MQTNISMGEGCVTAWLVGKDSNRERTEEWVLIRASRGLAGDQRTYGRMGGCDRRTWKENIGRN
jgi:hypothetical protein